MPRKQCKKCPWKKDVNPFEIGGEYSAEKHRGLIRTIAEPGSTDFVENGSELHMMACHETRPGREEPCAGWLHHQLGVGNNIALRLAAHDGLVDWRYELDGPQKPSFEATLPEEEPWPKSRRGPNRSQRQCAAQQRRSRSSSPH